MIEVAQPHQRPAAASQVTMGQAQGQTTIWENQSYSAYVEAVARFPYLQVEYIAGDIVMAPAPTPRHQIASANLMFALQSYSRQHGLGMVLAAPLDVQLEAETSIVQPDVIFIRQARTQDLIQEQSIQGAPDLIIEILSPSTARVDRAVKLQLYARHLVPEYWIVNPTDQTVEVYTLQAQGYLVAGIYTPEENITAGLFAQAQIRVGNIFGPAANAGDGQPETGPGAQSPPAA